MKKNTEEKSKKVELSRRPAGKRIIHPPTPRPIPLDHPAKALFSITNSATDAIDSGIDPYLGNFDNTIHPSIPDSIPTGIPNTIPSSIPTSTPASIPASTPASIPDLKKNNESWPEADERKPHDRKYEYRPKGNKQGTNERDSDYDASAPLDATHTASEKSVYSIMYRETISKNVRERHFGPAELMKKTGIRSRNTVHQAIYGLTKKLSIEVLTKMTGNPLGPRYRIYKPKEIEQRRRAAFIVIDPQTKKIITDSRDPDQHYASDSTGIPESIPTGIPDSIREGMPAGIQAGIDKNWDTTLPINNGVGIPKIGTHIKSKKDIGEGTGYLPSSSSKSEAKTDDENDVSHDRYLNKICDMYERLTGNSFTSNDAATAMKAAEIPAAIWGIAICYCMDRAPGHKFNHLAYVLEEARNHYQEMQSMPESDWDAILRHGIRTIERAKASGTWNPTTE